MGTFFEILITSLITFIAGFLCMRYKPKTKRKVDQKINQFSRNRSMRTAYRNYSAKFILFLLIGMTFFSGVFYLAERGYIILKW